MLIYQLAKLAAKVDGLQELDSAVEAAETASAEEAKDVEVSCTFSVSKFNLDIFFLVSKVLNRTFRYYS